MQITLLEVCGLIPSLQAMRLPKGSKGGSYKNTSDTVAKLRTEDSGITIFHTSTTMGIAQADLELARLVLAGDEHAKAIRGIMVYADITAPIYWWREMETYRAGRERLSCESTMHIDCKGLTGEQLVKAKEEMPMVKEQRAIDVFSYQTLRRIYHQRQHHRLPQWHEFCEWVEGLPFADMLITC